MRRTWDFLILGQGLAGSLLALALIERGRRVLVVGDSAIPSASEVAAGLINPLGGMRFGRPDNVLEWLAVAQRTYDDWGRRVGRPIRHEIPMVRLFRSRGQIRFFERRCADPTAQALLGSRFAPGGSGEPIRDPHGGFEQRRTGYVETPPLLSAIRLMLTQAGCFRDATIAYADIDLRRDGVRWRDEFADALVFCEGHRLQHNPWFDWLALQPDRGEILTLRAHAGMPSRIVNGAHWLIPQHGGDYRFGATHDHAGRDPNPTAVGRAALLAGLRALLTANTGAVIAQHAGIRPATRDRQPLLGRHPQQSRLAVFNGFGARGCLTIPWYAERFADFLLGRGDVPPEADVQRCAG